MKKIVIDFLEVVNKAFLDFLNDENSIPINEDNQYIIVLNSSNKKKLQFYIESEILNNSEFGREMLIVNSCNPINNWRNTGLIKPDKYEIDDSSVYVDLDDLKFFLDDFFANKMNFWKNGYMIFPISNIRLDRIDLINELVNTYLFKFVSICKYNIFIDGNNAFYRTKVLPIFLKKEIEEFLGNSGLILK